MSIAAKIKGKQSISLSVFFPQDRGGQKIQCR